MKFVRWRNEYNLRPSLLTTCPQGKKIQRLQDSPNGNLPQRPSRHRVDTLIIIMQRQDRLKTAIILLKHTGQTDVPVGGHREHSTQLVSTLPTISNG